jgi:hypothetical protein
LDTLKALSWLFKESLLYDPEERKRILEKGLEDTNAFLKAFGDGPWIEGLTELIDKYELKEAVSLNGKKLNINDKKLSLDLEKTKEFFSEALDYLQEKATEVLGKLLVNKKLKEIKNES